MNSKEYNPPQNLPGMLMKLSESLKTVNGKKVYGFLSSKIKNQANDILNTFDCR